VNGVKISPLAAGNYKKALRASLCPKGFCVLRNRKWVFAVLAAWVFATPALAADKPKLVVMFNIDQGRSDYPLPRPDGYGEPPRSGGAYRAFFTEGIVYRNTYYGHSVTTTEPGHMTLVTGGNPDTHGIPRNQWLNRETGEFVNDIYDSRYWILGNTKKTRPQRPGTAPTALLENTGTLGDRLIQSTDGKAKVFSIGMGDWPTIPVAGGEGNAIWYDATSGEFVSSDYFYAKLPPWVENWNKPKPVKRFLERHLPRDPDTGHWIWELLYDKGFYRNSSRNGPNSIFVKPPCYPSQTNCKYSLDATFNHYLPNKNPQDMEVTNYLMLYTPFADAILGEFAAELVKQEKLGQDDSTDLLMINLASQDWIGHMWGPDSLEHEDNFYRLDSTLGGIMTALRTVPKEDLLIVLAADHGVFSIPGYANGRGQSAGQLLTRKVVHRVNSSLLDTYGIGNLAIGIRVPSLYLDVEKILKNRLDVNDVARSAVKTVRIMEGVRYAWTKQDLIDAQTVPADEAKYAALMRKAVDQNPTDRSGEVLIVQKENWYFYEDSNDAAMHGSPYDNDRRVQLMFWGGPLKPGQVERRVHPRDVVPTIAKILGIDPPKASTGEPLQEILHHYGITHE